MDILIFIILCLVVIILSGLISGSEAAILSVSYPHAKELLSSAHTKRDKIRVKRLLEIKSNLQEYITTIVVLNNVVNIIGSIFIGLLASKIFGSYIVGVVSAVLTFLIILFSEIIPKLYGERFNKKISLHISLPLIILTKILFPLLWTLNKLVNLFFKSSEDSNHVSEGVIREMAILGKQEGSIDESESERIGNVFDMNDIEASHIMIPKNKVVSVKDDSTYKEIAQLAYKTGFTRFPVLSKDEVIGLVNVKDLFRFLGPHDDFKVSKIIRPVIFSPQIMKISTLEVKLKKSRIHMAVVVNEHGDFVGIVTLEDIIEEIMGDIEDEFDSDSQDDIKEMGDSKFQINASVDLKDLNEALGLNIRRTTNCSTLNGFLTSRLHRVANINDKVEIKEGTFRVIKRTKKKAVLVEYLRKEGI